MSKKTAIPHDECTIASGRLIHHMARYEKRRAVFNQLTEEGPQLVARERVEANSRFIEDQYLWLPHERAGEGDSTGLTAGKVADLAVSVVSELDAITGDLFILSASSYQTCEVMNVFFYGEFFVYRQGLAGVCNLLPQSWTSCRLPQDRNRS